jgi:Brp/Blh family beta-carotene 15,15'-monooxygenase
MKDKRTTLRAVAITAAILSIILELTYPAFSNSVKYPVLGLCLLFIGIPHGAIDHIVTSKLYNLSQTISDQAKFYIYYLVMMTIMTLIWIIHPLSGFLIFALLTVYHFGQADLEHLPINKNIKRVLFLSRGSMIMGLIIISDLQYTSPILLDLTGINILEQISGASIHKTLLVILPLQYLIIQTAALVYYKFQASDITYILFDAFVVAALFLIVNPILAFAIYFGLWHSAGHVKEMMSYFEETGKKMTLKSFYLKALPLNLITLIGIGLIYWISQTYQFQLQIVSLLFIIISVLTLPHMLIVEKMYSRLSSLG